MAKWTLDGRILYTFECLWDHVALMGVKFTILSPSLFIIFHDTSKHFSLIKVSAESCEKCKTSSTHGFYPRKGEVA